MSSPVCFFCGKNHYPLWICTKCGFINCDGCDDELIEEIGRYYEINCPNCHTDEYWEELWYDKKEKVWKVGDELYKEEDWE